MVSKIGVGADVGVSETIIDEYNRGYNDGREAGYYEDEYELDLVISYATGFEKGYKSGLTASEKIENSDSENRGGSESA